MTSRERLLRTFRREKTDRVPIAPFLYYNSVYEWFRYKPQLDPSCIRRRRSGRGPEGNEAGFDPEGECRSGGVLDESCTCGGEGAGQRSPMQGETARQLDLIDDRFFL
jgi:hypothetical protein